MLNKVKAISIIFILLKIETKAKAKDSNSIISDFKVLQRSLISGPFPLRSLVVLRGLSRRTVLSGTFIFSLFTFSLIRFSPIFILAWLILAFFGLHFLGILFQELCFGLFLSINLDHFHDLIVLFFKAGILEIVLFYVLSVSLDFLVMLKFFIGDLFFSDLFSVGHD